MNELYTKILNEMFLGLSPYSVYNVRGDSTTKTILFKVLNDNEDAEAEDTFTFYECVTHGCVDGCNWEIKTGATRLVIVIDNYDDVIKMDLDGDIELDYLPEEHKETEILLDLLNNQLFFPEEISGGYTRKEINLYSELPPALKRLFIESKKIGEIGIIEVFEQMRVEHTYCDGVTCSSLSQTSNSINLQKSHKKTGININFLNDVCEMYGNETLAALGELDVDEFLTDIHDNNIGVYIKNQMYYPIIIDYAGYYS